MHALMLSVAKYACTAAICGCTAAIYGRNAAISDSGEGGAEAKKIFMDRNDLSGWALVSSFWITCRNHTQMQKKKKKKEKNTFLRAGVQCTGRH